MQKYLSLCFLLLSTTLFSQQIDNQKVSTFFQEQQFEEALTYLKPFEKAEPANIKTLGYLAYAHYMLDEDKAARNYFDKILVLDSENISALKYLAMLTANKAPDSAILLNQRLIRLQPTVAAYYRNLGDGFRRIQKGDSALAYYNRAYTMLPTDHRNASALGDLLITGKNYTRADSVLETALALDSNNSNIIRLRIKSAYESGDYASAVRPGERMMHTEELSSNALTHLALAYYNLKKYQDSYRVCQFMLDNGFELESVYYYQAKAASKMKDYVNSNILLDKCLSVAISEMAETYYYALGQNYEATRQYKKAIAQYDTAYYLFHDPNMIYYMANVYETNLKDMEQARKQYTRYLALARPSTSDEKKAYAYVLQRWGKPKKDIPVFTKADSTALKDDE